MTIQDLALFQGLGAKMGYLNQRQSVIAQNVANADTTGYIPKDLSEVDFSSFVDHLIDTRKVKIQGTDADHYPARNGDNLTKVENQKEVYEVSPSGNAVDMEEQLVKSGSNMMDYNLMMGVYQKQIGMFKIALGAR